MSNNPHVPSGTRIVATRRSFIATSLTGVLSGTAVALLAGQPSLARAAAAKAGDAQNDIKILGSALAAERRAVAAYGVGGGSGLLSPGTLKVAQTFAGHHRKHGEALIKAITDFGGKVGEEPSAESYAFPVATLKNEADVLTFAAGLERGAISAYVGAIPLFDHRDLSRAAASILADEAMHWAVLRSALGLDPVPEAFFV